MRIQVDVFRKEKGELSVGKDSRNSTAQVKKAKIMTEKDRAVLHEPQKREKASTRQTVTKKQKKVTHASNHLGENRKNRTGEETREPGRKNGPWGN